MPSPRKPAGAAGRAPRVAPLFKTTECSFKAIDGDDGTFELYAAVFGNVDRGGEVIEPGAFGNLEEFVADGVGLVGHDVDGLPVALILEATQDAKGLKIRGRFHSTPYAQQVRTVILERIAAGKSVKCSIGYKVVDWVREQVDGRTIVRLKKLFVYEFSFVNIPMNPMAGVVSAKSAAHEEPMSPDPGLFATVKEWLGLAKKKAAAPGGAMSPANFDALSKFADMLEANGDGAHAEAESLADRARGLRDHGDGCKALAAAMREHLAPLDPDGDGRADADADADAEPSAKADHDLTILRLFVASNDPPAAA